MKFFKVLPREIMEPFEFGLPAVQILYLASPDCRNIDFQNGCFADIEQLKLIAILVALWKSKLTLKFHFTTFGRSQLFL